MITTDTHVFFYTNCFSNFWSTRDVKPQFVDPITGIAFNNTEEAFMWQKSHFFGDAETCAKIVAHAAARGHPMDVKNLGRQVKGYNDKEWSCVREGSMAYVNLLKYQQNPDLGEKLKATRDRIIVEASPVDKIWGVGLDEKAAAEEAERQIRTWTFSEALLTEVQWPGLNLLGKALMTVRGLL